MPIYRRYVELGRRFIEAQAREYGTDSYYAVDQFNEMVHPSHARAMIGRTLTRCAACAALPHCGIAAAAGAGVQGDGISQHGRHDTIRVAAGSRSRGRLGRAGVHCATIHSSSAAHWTALDGTGRHWTALNGKHCRAGSFCTKRGPKSTSPTTSLRSRRTGCLCSTSWRRRRRTGGSPARSHSGRSSGTSCTTSEVSRRFH